MHTHTAEKEKQLLSTTVASVDREVNYSSFLDGVIDPQALLCL